MTLKVAPAVIVLNQNSVVMARKIVSVLPGSKLYGLTNRTQDVDLSFANFGEMVRELFAQGTPLIGICAAGILIRTIAPLLTDKQLEPPVIAIAEDGSAVVPLLGGINGVNDLARLIAQGLNVPAAITTAGDLRFRTALLSPPTGYHLANPDDAKKFISDLLAGATVKLAGTATWLSESKLPIDPNGTLTIQITEKQVTPTANCLVYHPANLAIALTAIPESVEETISLIQQQLTEANLASKSIAGIFAPLGLSGESKLSAIAQSLGVPTRFFPESQLTEFVIQGYSLNVAIALLATGKDGETLPCSWDFFNVAIAPKIIYPETIGQSRGKLAIVGTGPGGLKWMSPEVKDILNAATDLVGYKTYLNLIGSLADHKQRHESDNREEGARARLALDLAAQGKYVAVVSSGDPGIYAMASAVFEVLDREHKPEWENIDIQVAPGISAMQAAAAVIGAPLGHDFCVISLSDILKPWSAIEQRIRAAALADFVIAFYNPVSLERIWQLTTAKNILLEHRHPSTPVIIAQNLGRQGQTVRVITLEQLESTDADMRTIILIGSTKTRQMEKSHGKSWVYTPRHYAHN
jgi:cobalt-precorrin 5A hydrolase/precorrin-3B C17-methyltransferase